MPPLPPYTITRTSRRSISIQISRTKGLVVRAPLSVPEDIVHAFVKRKSEWIRKHTMRYDEQKIQENHTLHYLGQPHAYKYDPLQKEPLVHSEGLFTFSEQVRDGSSECGVLEIWYRKQARAYLDKRVRHYAEKYGFRYGTVRITGALSRWGSCSFRNNINFPWRLLMAPPEVVDYVVVHELAHTVHKNHSPRFWRLIESIIPDWRQHRVHLREEGWKYALPKIGTFPDSV